MFLDNKFTKEYDELINFVKLQIRKKGYGEYFEQHHIIPKSLGGNNNKSNLVLLTPDEHFHCHILLTKMTEGRNLIKMQYALYCLRRKHKKEFSCIDFDDYDEYFKARKAIALDVSQRFKGKKLTDEHRKNISLSMKGNMSDDHKLAISKTHKGKIPWNKGLKGISLETSMKISKSKINKKRNQFSNEWRKNMSLAHKGKLLGAENPMARACVIHNISYSCIKEAATALNISPTCCRYRILSQSTKWISWRFID